MNMEIRMALLKFLIVPLSMLIIVNVSHAQTWSLDSGVESCTDIYGGGCPNCNCPLYTSNECSGTPVAGTPCTSGFTTPQEGPDHCVKTRSVTTSFYVWKCDNTPQTCTLGPLESFAETTVGDCNFASAPLTTNRPSCNAAWSTGTVLNRGFDLGGAPGCMVDSDCSDRSYSYYDCLTSTPVPTGATGTQTRTVECRNNFGDLIPDSFCPSPKPPESQTCAGPTVTPTPTSSGCWVWATGIMPSDRNDPARTVDAQPAPVESLIQDTSLEYVACLQPFPLSTNICTAGSEYINTPGDYPQTSVTFRKALLGTLDGIVIGPNTTITLYTEDNYGGASATYSGNGTRGVALYNNAGSPLDMTIFNKTFTPASLEAQFPRGTGARIQTNLNIYGEYGIAGVVPPITPTGTGSFRMTCN